MNAGHSRALVAIAAAAFVWSSCVEAPQPRQPPPPPAAKLVLETKPLPQRAPQPDETVRKSAPLIIQPPRPAPPKVTEAPKQTAAEKTPPVRDHAADLQAILAADHAFAVSAEHMPAAAAFHEHLTADAVLMMPGELPVRGSDAIKVDLTVNSPGTMLWHAKGAQVAAAGDLGYTWGTYEVRPETVENPRFLNRFGKYVIIWERQKDQSWKACLFSASMSPSAERH